MLVPYQVKAVCRKSPGNEGIPELGVMDNALIAERFKGLDDPAPVSLAAGQVGRIVAVVLEVGLCSLRKVAVVCLNVSEEVKRRMVGNFRRKEINWFSGNVRLTYRGSTLAEVGAGNTPLPLRGFRRITSALSLTFL